MQDALETCLLTNNIFFIQSHKKPQFTHWGYSVDVASSFQVVSYSIRVEFKSQPFQLVAWYGLKKDVRNVGGGVCNTPTPHWKKQIIKLKWVRYKCNHGYQVPHWLPTRWYQTLSVILGKLQNWLVPTQEQPKPYMGLCSRRTSQYYNSNCSEWDYKGQKLLPSKQCRISFTTSYTQLGMLHNCLHKKPCLPW